MLITGSTRGIGRATALAVGRQGARVLVTGRDEARGAAVVQQLRGMGSAGARFLRADLSTQAGVRALADAVRAIDAPLDALVHNAGAWFEERAETAEGFERTWALNHLAVYRLTHALLDRVRAAAAGRVVVVASAAHRGGGLDWTDLGKTAWARRGWPAYQQSKFANIVFTAELARRLRGTGVTANCLHPGFVASDFGQGGSLAARALLLATRPLQISPRRSARTVAWATLSADVAHMSGEYFKSRRVALPHPDTQDPAVGERLWRVSAAQCGLDPDWP